MVARFRAARPGAIVVVSADHGEAFGEHNARYHGTTVYEEQVRVPLVISAPGLIAPRREIRPVQLIDLMPTILAAYDIPRPPRVRGRDLGPLLTAHPPSGAGVAYAEVEDAAMLAEGDERLICSRTIAACALYDVAHDPTELSPLANATTMERMRREMGALIASSARLEGLDPASASWPDSLRRAYAGDLSAALDVAPLLDDVDVAYRRRAAEVLARLASAETEPAVRRALTYEKDDVVRKWLAIARLRLVQRPTGPDLVGVSALLRDDLPVARWSALALAEAFERDATAVTGEARGRAFDVLVAWLPAARADGALARALISKLPSFSPDPSAAKRATPALIDALDDVRTRVVAATALGLMGDRSAAPRLDDRLSRSERHQDARVPEALALARLGMPDRALWHMARLLGVAEPPPGCAGALLEVATLGQAAHPWLVLATKGSEELVLAVPEATAHRLVVVGDVGARPEVLVDGAAVEPLVTDGGAFVELQGRVVGHKSITVRVRAAKPGVPIVAAIVARDDDLPPPKPDRSLQDADGGSGE